MSKIENIIRQNIIVSTSFFIIIFLLLFFYLKNTIHVQIKTNENISVDLKKSKWKFYSYDLPSLSYQSLEPNQKINKNNTYLDVLSKKNTKFVKIWYQSSFQLKNKLAYDQILFLDKMFPIQKIYLNGDLVFSCQNDKENDSIRFANKDQSFYLQKEKFIQGNNLLSIQLKVNTRNVKSAYLQLDKYFISVSKDFYGTYFRSHIASFVIIFFIFLISIYYLILFLRLKDIKENLYFFLFGLISFLLLSSQLVSSIFEISIEIKKILDIIYLFAEYSFNIFLVLLLYSLYKISIKDKFIYGFIVIHSLLFIITFISSLPVVWLQISFIFSIICLLEFLYFIFLVSNQIKKKNIENIALLISLVFFSVLSGYHFIFTGEYIIKNEFLGFSVFMIIVSIAIILGNRYVSLFKKTEELNKNIEKLVIDRTEELQQTLKKLLARNLTQAKELNMARNIQNSLLPQEDLLSDEIKVMAYYSPMQDIGGDSYDYFYLDENRIVFIITDVSGHGVPAALIAVMLKLVFENHIDIEESPADVMKLVNNSMLKYLMNSDYFTGIYAILDTEKMTFTYASGGHPPMIMLKKDKMKSILLKNTGTIIGFQKDLKIDNRTIPLNSGDRIFFYTDGVTEILDEKDQPLGFERLIQVLEENKDLSLNEIYNKIINSIYSHTDIKSIDDDITFFIIEIN